MTGRDRFDLGDVPWLRVASTVLSAGLVAGPLALGFATGHAAAGGIGALGAYLWTASHITDKRPVGLPIGVATTVLLGLAGVTGALAGGHLWLLVVMVVLWAGFQAVADVAGGALRMPVAMAALCMLLSAIGGGTTPTGALWHGLLTLGGAAWITGTEIVRHPPWRSPGPIMSDFGFKALRGAWPAARGYALLLAIPTALVAAVTGAFQVSHGAWTATTVLRVLRPDHATTITRSWQRATGTAGGALIAALLLSAAPTSVTTVIVLVVAVTAMQLIGPRRYAVYSFFLTVIALELGAIGHRPDFGVAVIRVVLTLVGTVVAVISGLIFERLTATKR
jgi:hypothetical protein